MNTTTQEHGTAGQASLYMALELSNSTWRLAFTAGNRRRQVAIEAGDLAALREAVKASKTRFRLVETAPVVSCYEAGRDGFWIHRDLISTGVDNVVVESSSIEVSRRRRRAKTDRIDADKLLTLLLRHHGGERGLWSVVKVPSAESEDARRLHRELDRLKRERLSHGNRIKGLLVTQGLRLELDREFPTRLQTMTLWDGSPLPADLKAEVLREYERLLVVRQQIRDLEGNRRQILKAPQTDWQRQVVKLTELGAIGPASAWMFVTEFFGWRDFKNRRQVGALAGLTGTPYSSGDSERDQGISKAGNSRIRTMAVEIAWLWLRYQPDSALSRWYQERFASGGRRMRRVGIVALARKILVALWRYLEDGVVPEGARLIPAKL